MKPIVEVFDSHFLYLTNLGDITTYYAMVGRRPYTTGASIYVTIGGNYAPVGGGFFPEHFVKEFGEDVINWAYGSEEPFYEYIISRHYINYMMSKQNAHANKWEVIVAFIVAWAYINDLDTDPEFMQLVGILNHNNNVQAVFVLEQKFDGVGVDPVT